MDLKMKNIKDITIEELYSNCPIVKSQEIAQCARDCCYFNICHKLPMEGAFEAAMIKVSSIIDDIDEDVVVEADEEYCLGTGFSNYDSHSIIIENVKNLTIIQGENYGSN